VLTAIITWRQMAAASAKRSRRAPEALNLDVGGLFRATMEHLSWQNSKLQEGDEVRIRIVDAEKVTKPTRREPFDPDLVAKSEKQYLEKTAAKYGWKIVKPKSNPKTKSKPTATEKHR
jgi:hypothetical protein